MPIDFDILSEPALTSHVALQLLRAAWDAAGERAVDVWQFAVDIDQFRAAGVTHTELRCLLVDQLAKHAREVTRLADRTRRFRPVQSLMLDQTTCFVLTEEGRRLAARDANGRAGKKADSRRKQRAAKRPIADKPAWDAARRELRFGGEVVRRFQHHAPTQEVILGSFELQGWPAVIADPLALEPGVDVKRRLRDAAKNLNRGLRGTRLRFSVTGNGRALGWAPAR